MVRGMMPSKLKAEEAKTTTRTTILMMKISWRSTSTSNRSRTWKPRTRRLVWTRQLGKYQGLGRRKESSQWRSSNRSARWTGSPRTISTSRRWRTSLGESRVRTKTRDNSSLHSTFSYSIFYEFIFGRVGYLTWLWYTLWCMWCTLEFFTRVSAFF